MNLPKSFNNLVNNLTMLPGVGEKTAERYVYSIYENDKEEIENLAESLLYFKNNIKVCENADALVMIKFVKYVVMKQEINQQYVL